MVGINTAYYSRSFGSRVAIAAGGMVYKRHLDVGVGGRAATQRLVSTPLCPRKDAGRACASVGERHKGDFGHPGSRLAQPTEEYCASVGTLGRINGHYPHTTQCKRCVALHG